MKKRNRRMGELIRAEIARVRAERAGLAHEGDNLPTLAQIEAARGELRAAGKPDGVRSIAKLLHSSPTTVQRRIKSAHRNS
jgi:hypothetical protein